MAQLTTNFLTDLVHAPENAEIFDSQPIVQFLSVKPVDPTQAGTPQERYRVIISDGTNYLQSMMATQLNHFIHEQAVIKHSIVKLTRFTLSTVRDKRLTIILGLEVIEKTHEKIGEPTPIETPSAVNTGAVNTPQPVAAASNSNSNTHSVQEQSNKSQPARPSRPTYPIESLSPYQNNWTIKARVTQKSEVKRWSNQKGEGQLFSVTLMDETGEIRATGFNAVVDELFNKFQEGKVYYVSKGRVNLAKKKFNSVANDYEISLEKTTEVEECRDTAGLPQVKYNFTELGDLGNLEKDATCDVIAIVKEVGQLGDITTKQGKTLHKRELTMVDRSAVQTRLTLWGKQAEDWNRFDHPVVAFKGVKIGDFGGRSLSMLSSSTMTLEPDIVEAHGLRGWYDAMGANTNFTSQGGGGGGGGTSGPIRREDFRTLIDVKESDLGGGEKPDYFTARGTVVHIKPEPVSYPGCKSCNKKVQPSQSGEGWRCEKCDIVMTEPEYRYMLAFAVADYSGQAWLQSFNDSATIIMNMPANQLNQYKESDEAQFNAALHHASFATYDFVCRAKQDTYNDQTRVRYAISRMQPLDYKEEAKHLVDLLRSPWAL